MTRPQVSVIINNYNYGRFLGRAIDTALDQPGVTAEVIVVDDGSSDDSRDIIARYGDRIVPVLQDNAGQAAAINAGVHNSRGAILSFLDADDWWAPGKLAATVKAFDADADVGLAYHRLQPLLSDGTVAFRPIPPSLCDGDLAPRLVRSAGRWPFPMTSAVSVRRSLWDRVGDIPADFRISADAWLVGLYPFVCNVAALPDALGFYRIHDNTWYRAVDDAAMLRKRVAHWQATVAATNAFLHREGLPWRLDPADHVPSRIASARLDGARLPDKLRLIRLGLRDRGEPHPLRRLRDTLRDVRAVGSTPMSSPAATAVPSS